MTLDVRRLDSIKQVNKNQWNNVVQQSDLGCVSHRYEWLRAVEVGTTHDPAHLVVSKKGNPIAILPAFETELGPLTRLTSMRPGYGGPIAMTDEEQALELLLDAVATIATGTTVVSELRTYDQRYLRYHELFREHGYRIRLAECRFPLDLTQGWDAIFENMHGERRRGIRRGHDTDFDVVDESITERTLARFYNDYTTVMERVGTDVLPWPFIRELGTIEDRLKLFSLSVDGDRHGSYLYLRDDEQETLQHLFTAVTEADFEYNAAELLHEHAINWGIDNGYDTYELRGAVPDFRSGLFQFKSYFGADPAPLFTWERGHPDPVLPALTLGRSIEDRYWS